ncbi:uncharacterized protein EDB93DRAFT_1140122 [Suillus bovinus]|uniref:uncharacterized protein n=1 Tax=Suillus bovinus TaxID=48563 RepID=UPI001B879B6A|nr:uncharacterized protein EDB93DRAFT_1140122 [Suillus bovinus]KAG2151232.1 hypothetical protein EDB93DRAFT_1140122 [Suillus bovinus]
MSCLVMSLLEARLLSEVTSAVVFFSSSGNTVRMSQQRHALGSGVYSCPCANESVYRSGRIFSSISPNLHEYGMDTSALEDHNGGCNRVFLMGLTMKAARLADEMRSHDF